MSVHMDRIRHVDRMQCLGTYSYDPVADFVRLLAETTPTKFTETDVLRAHGWGVDLKAENYG